MGEPPPLSPGAPILLVLLSLAGSGAPGDAGKESKTVFTDPDKVHHGSVSPNSGLHPLIAAVYMEYGFCLPQHWRHSFKHKAVASLYRPCACPCLHWQLALLARACLAPHGGPTWEQPLASVARRDSLQRAEVGPSQAASRLKRQAGRSGCGGKSKSTESLRRSLKRALGKGGCPLHQAQVLQKLVCERPARRLHPLVRKRRALNWPKRRLGGIRKLTAPLPIQREATLASLPQKKELPEQSGARLSPTKPQPSVPTLPTEAGAARTTGGCRCPGGKTGKAQEQPAEDGKAQRVGARVPTPRTEEAAWAASALTFLLVVLTLAVLYTRLHQKCRRGRSLYWTGSSEEDQDTVAAVIKRRLLSAQVRRKKRLRQQQRRELLPSSSSDSSD